MSDYICKLPNEPTFIQKGLTGFAYLLENKAVQVYFCDSTQGHENYEISKKCTHIYYILEGKGFFELDGVKYDVRPGMLIEVPPHVEYCYTGKMKLLLIMNPPWFEGNGEITRVNHNVK